MSLQCHLGALFNWSTKGLLNYLGKCTFLDSLSTIYYRSKLCEVIFLFLFITDVNYFWNTNYWKKNDLPPKFTLPQRTLRNVVSNLAIIFQQTFSSAYKSFSNSPWNQFHHFVGVLDVLNKSLSCLHSVFRVTYVTFWKSYLNVSTII